MTREEIREQLNDVQALTCTLMGEALSEPLDGILAVASVIRNRATRDLHGDAQPDWWGEGIKGVCLKKLQFSCWWEDNLNSDRVYTIALILLQNKPQTPKIQAFLLLLAKLVVEGAYSRHDKGRGSLSHDSLASVASRAKVGVELYADRSSRRT